MQSHKFIWNFSRIIDLLFLFFIDLSDDLFVDNLCNPCFIIIFFLILETLYSAIAIILTY